MFENLKLISKALFWGSSSKDSSVTVKEIGGWVDLSLWDSMPFYPLANTSQGVSTLSRTDYLRLYKWWAFRCVCTVADAVAQLWFRLKKSKNDDTDVDHPYLDLLEYETLQGIVSFMLLNWSCYLYPVKIWNKIESLEILRPDLITIEQSDTGFTKRYIYNGNGITKTFTPDDLIVFNMFSPLKTYPYEAKGFSPMQAVAIQMEMDSAANIWNWNFFKNNASSRDVLMTDQNPDSEVLERLEAKRNMNHKWVNNAHKTAILPGWLKYQNIDVSQKEMDFVDSRRFTRDEVLAIFNVPKAVIWIADDVNRANWLTAERTFYKTNIWPISTQIAKRLTKTLFKWLGIFEFINVVPVDTEQLKNDYDSWWITTNEYRRQRGFKQIKDGDRLKLSPFLLSEPVEYEDLTTASKWTKSPYFDIIGNALKKSIKWTVQYKEARTLRGEAKYKDRNTRLAMYEQKYIKIINEIFDMQRRDILSDLNTDKSVHLKKFNWNIIKYLAIWEQFIFPVQKEVIGNEWNAAYAEIWLTTFFETGDPVVNKWMRANIDKFGSEVDRTTKDKIFEIIEDGNLEWLSSDSIARNVTEAFDWFSKSRAKMIARTEITRAANYGEEKAWIDSGVVEEKERYTAQDEITCPRCRQMDGKVIGLWKSFIKNWETMTDWKQEYTINYENVKTPPLHPSCRCTLLPVIK